MKQNYLKIIIIVCILDLVSSSISAQILPEIVSFIPAISQPTLSPSGDEILFSGEDYQGLYLLSLKTNQIKIIANNPGAGYRANWSADRTKIGFKLIYEENRQQPVYYDINKDQIIPLYPISASAGVPSFSDNGIIVFTIGKKLHVVNQELQSIYEFELNSYANLVPISPDGKLVVYNDLNDQLWLLELKKGEKKQISSGKEGYFNPIWSPDSKKIIFSSLTGYLYMFHIETAHSYFIGRGSSANWLEHGESLIFCEEEWDERFQLISSRLTKCRYDGTHKKLLYESSNQMVRFVGYSPQNHKIAYLSENYLVIGKVHGFQQIIPIEIEQKFLFDDINASIQPAKSFQNKLQKFDDQIKLQSFDAPYLHQVYDTPDWFNGHWACGATSAMMAIAYYDILPAWNYNCSMPHPHISKHGRYVCEVYTYNGYTYNIGGYDPDGNLGYGGYGFIIQNDWENTKEFMAKYARQHKINSSVDWSPSYARFSNEMDKRYPVVILNSLTSAGHYILGIGYNSAERSVIVNDPYGNKNQGYMNYNGKNVIYDWPGYNSGHANLNIVHCLIYMRMDRTDLAPSTFSLSDTLNIGEEVPIQFKVYNKGLISSDSCSISFYLSSNQYFNQSDIFLGQLPCPMINPHDSLEFTATVQLPDSLPSAKWAIGVWIDEDDSLKEIDETNNLHYEVFVLKGYPLVYGFYPSPDATISNSRPEISVHFKDDYFGIIVDSTKFYLNGKNIISNSLIENARIIYIPESDLTPTSHRARIEITNKPGYTTIEEWDFHVQASAVDNRDMSLPLQWLLAQNYPNPFNTSTRIQYHVAKQGHIKIEIFAIDGKLVKSLVNDERSPGSYYCVWNGTDDQNKPVTTGIYFYRMISDSFHDIGRMIYLK